ncbi:MAG: T9SS type A sorting domain-containing protein [Bacteroidaceae bacterium]|nr:T9SS type A sorting domain-containing protein [Bacteroidaceae bacterium]
MNWKTGMMSVLLAAALVCPSQASAATKNVICVKTNTGQYFPVVRVSMMVVPDGGSTFEIVLKDGVGASNVESISFEKHEEEVDYSKYKTDSNGEIPVDLSKKIYLLTSTGKYFTLKSLPEMQAIEGSKLFNVVAGSTTEPNVESVHFFRSNTPDETATGVESVAAEEEQLTLQTRIASQMQISGCGNATSAVVYDTAGKKVGQFPVADGMTTVIVNDLPTGVYVVKVGNKALKFMKK